MTCTPPVTPAKAGVQNILKRLDSCFRRNDGVRLPPIGQTPMTGWSQRNMKIPFRRKPWHPQEKTKPDEKEVAMARKEDTKIVQVLHPVCCGLDVHKDSVTACLIVETPAGQRIEQREFRTFTHDLRTLKEWLLDNECPVVAIEEYRSLLAPGLQCFGGSGSGNSRQCPPYQASARSKDRHVRQQMACRTSQTRTGTR